MKEGVSKHNYVAGVKPTLMISTSVHIRVLIHSRINTAHVTEISYNLASLENSNEHSTPNTYWETTIPLNSSFKLLSSFSIDFSGSSLRQDRTETDFRSNHRMFYRLIVSGASLGENSKKYKNVAVIWYPTDIILLINGKCSISEKCPI